MQRIPFVLYIIATVICLCTALPLIYITYHAFQGDPALWQRLWTGQIIRLTQNTLVLVVTVITCTCVMGVTTAWLIERTDVPGRNVWRWVLALPLAIPGYVAAVCYMFLLRRGGFVDHMAISYFGFERHQFPLPPLFNLWGVTAIMSLYTFPYVFLAVAAALRSLDATLDEAARIAGRGTWGVFSALTIRLLIPAIAAGSLLTGLYVLSDFGTVALLRYQTFTTAVYRQFAGEIGRTAASIISLGLIGISLPLLLSEGWLHRRDRRYTRASNWRPRRVIPLGMWRWVAFSFIFVLATLSLFLPLTVLIGLTLRGILTPTEIDRIWNVDAQSIWQYGVNSLVLSLLAATLATLLALIPTYLAVRFRGPFGQTLLNLSKIAFAFPGIIVGLGFLMFFIQTPIYATLLALVLGLAFSLLPKAITIGESTLELVSPTLEQAAHTMGQGLWMTLWRVTIPLAAPGLLAGWALVFVTAMKELPLLVILRPPGFDTLAIRVWEAANDSVYTQAAPPALFLIVLTTFTLGLVYTVGRFGLDRVVQERDELPERSLV